MRAERPVVWRSVGRDNAAVVVVVVVGGGVVDNDEGQDGDDDGDEGLFAIVPATALLIFCVAVKDAVVVAGAALYLRKAERANRDTGYIARPTAAPVGIARWRTCVVRIVRERVWSSA